MRTVDGRRNTKISEIIIDADKDWSYKRISNLPEPANGHEPAIKKITVESLPPTGKFKVVNLYVDPDTGKCVVEYDDTPQP